MQGDITCDLRPTPRHGAMRLGGPQYVYHAGPTSLAERDQDGTVHDLHQEARDPVIGFVDRLPRADVVPPAVGRAAHDRAAQFAAPKDAPAWRQASSIAYTVPSTLKSATARPRTVTTIPRPGDSWSRCATAT